jgi:ankyrin repeat protein
VAVEGEENVETFYCPIEAPAAEWQVRGRANSEGQLTLTIADAPEELQGEQWRITNTTFSEGLEGRIENMPTRLNHGANNLNVILDQIVLQEEASHVIFTIQGPDSGTRTCQIDLIALCVAQLRGDMSELDRNLADRLLVVNDEHETETERLYQLPPETVTDPRVNREKQAEIEERLNLIDRDLEAYDRDLQRLEALELQDPTHPNRQLPRFRRGKKRLKNAIASLKSAQIQLQQQCTSAHEALLTIQDENEQAIETLLNDPKMNVNHVDGGGTLLQKAIENRYNYTVRRLLEKGADANLASQNGQSPLYTAITRGCGVAINILLEHKADLNRRYHLYHNQNLNALATVLLEYGFGEYNDDYLQFFSNQIKKFLGKGANVNARCNQGETALHYGVCTWNIEIVNALLNAGADVNARNNEGMTALDKIIENIDLNPYRCAGFCKNEIMQIIKQLREHGAYCANKELIIKNTELRREDIDLLEKERWPYPSTP